MDATLQGHAMQAAKPKPKPFLERYNTLGQFVDFGKRQGVISAIALLFAWQYPALRREDRAEQAARDEALAARYERQAEEFRQTAKQISADGKEQTLAVKDWSERQTTILVDALSRNAQKLEETTKTFKGAAESVNSAAEKIEAATTGVQ